MTRKIKRTEPTKAVSADIRPVNSFPNLIIMLSPISLKTTMLNEKTPNPSAASAWLT